jgi:hypothetical protein
VPQIQADPVAPLTNSQLTTHNSQLPALTEDMPVQPIIRPERQNPSATYYIILAVLIALSILTLWLYQKRASISAPNIITPMEQQKPVIEPVVTPAPIIEPTIYKFEEPVFLDRPARPLEPIIIQEPGFQAITTLPAQINMGEFNNMPEEFDSDIPPFEQPQQQLLCDDGTMPVRGCCGNEILTEVGPSTFACCPPDDPNAECFDVLL